MGRRILVAASGTGGHLLPALYISKALMAEDPALEISFVGTGSPLEERLIDGAKIPRFIVSAKKLRRMGLGGLLTWLLHVPTALLQNWRLYSSYRPDVVVGVGGYASVFPVVVAWIRGCRTWVHEAERRAGWANLLLSTIATRTSLSFEDAQVSPRARTVFTGQPLRPELVTAQFERGSLEQLKKPTVFITGGSQGSRAIDEAAQGLVPLFKEKGISVIHQARPENVAQLTKAYQESGVQAEVLPFIDDMVRCYKAATIIVSRSGLGMLRELRFVGKPVIFIPLPGAEEQEYNARLLEREHQALVCLEGPGFSDRLRESLVNLLEPEQYPTYCRGTAESAHEGIAAQRIAQGVLGIMKP